MILNKYITFIYFFTSLFVIQIHCSSNSKQSNHSRQAQAKQSQNAAKNQKNEIIVDQVNNVLKQYFAIIQLPEFPTKDEHGTYNEELPKLFNELKALFAQLSLKDKKAFVKNFTFLKILKTFNACTNSIMGKIQKKINESQNIVPTQIQMNNFKIQLELQSSMMIWLCSIACDDTKKAYKFALKNINDQKIQMQKQISNMIAMVTNHAIQTAVNKENHPTQDLEILQARLDDAHESNPPNLAFNPELNAHLPENIQRGLVQGESHTPAIIDYFKQHPQQLLVQDSEGWTPVMQAASHGHIHMLDLLLQIIGHHHYASKSIPERFFQSNRVLVNYRFSCHFAQMEHLCSVDPNTSSKWARDYVVTSHTHRPFKCRAFIETRAYPQKVLEEQSIIDDKALNKLGAYIFIKSLHVKAKSYLNIIVIDDAMTHNKLVDAKNKYSQALKGQLDKALSEKLQVAPLRTIIHSFLTTELPINLKSSLQAHLN